MTCRLDHPVTDEDRDEIQSFRSLLVVFRYIWTHKIKYLSRAHRPHSCEILACCKVADRSRKQTGTCRFQSKGLQTHHSWHSLSRRYALGKQTAHPSEYWDVDSWGCFEAYEGTRQSQSSRSLRRTRKCIHFCTTSLPCGPRTWCCVPLQENTMETLAKSRARVCSSTYRKHTRFRAIIILDTYSISIRRVDFTYILLQSVGWI